MSESLATSDVLAYLLEHLGEIEGSAIRLNDGPLMWIHTEQEVRDWLIEALARP